MKRRNFIQIGSIGVAASLSGCVGPLPDPLGGGEEIENGGPDPDDLNIPEYARYIPTESQNDGAGVRTC